MKSFGTGVAVLDLQLVELPAAMATKPLPAAPYTRDFKDTSITVWWLADKVPADVDHVSLEYREFPKPEWKRVEIAAGTVQHTVEGLFPNATFEFRLTYVWKDGTESGPGPAVAADTLAAGCVPKEGEKKSKGCIVQ